jgi:4-alpha-glucanotransferase
VRFLLGVHDHQPLGNFDEVIGRLTEEAYLPFLIQAEACVPLRLTVHVSGPLLEWWERHDGRPLDLLARMAEAGRAEFLLSGWSEPVLAAIPSEDRRGQVARMRERIERRFGTKPTGLWLTERVFDSAILPDLAAEGVEYLLVDDRHFLAAGFEPRDLDGPYLTEESGRRLALFPISQRLRYLIPFRPVEELKREALAAREEGRGMLVYADDGEKFGGWPGTKEWVYGRGWLRDFLRAVEDLARSGIEFDTFGGALRAAGTKGLAYLPTASYAEMEEWTLPPGKARALRGARERAEREGADGAFLRGSHWKHFLVRYPESNLLHKKTLAVSRAFHERGVRDEAALGDLYGAQGNDPYWHGVFGGLYLPHLRGAAWTSLARAEAFLRRGEGLSVERGDLDLDGKEEVWVHSSSLSAVLAPARGGSIVDLTTFDPPHNWAAALARRPEAYHGEPGEGREAGHEGIATIHDAESRRSGRTPYDAGMRSLFVDRFPGPGATPEAFEAGNLDDRGDFAGAAYGFETRPDGATLLREGTVAGARARVEKTYRFGDGAALEVRWRVEGAEAFATEATFFPAFLARGRGWMRAEGREAPWGEPRDLGSIARLEFVEGSFGVRLVLGFAPAAQIWTFPVQTLSRSEKDFERTTQGIALLARWPAREGSLAVRVEKGT